MIRTFISALLALVRAGLMPQTTLALENAALRQQLTVCLRIQKRVRLRAEDRFFWMALRRLWPQWTRSLIIVQPVTVIGWQRKGFRAMWRRFIKCISGDHPEWGEDKIAEGLAAKFGIWHSTSTIRRYRVPRQSITRGGKRTTAARV
ncbi:hypothetical protein ACFL6M_01995 [Candidatus Eisenbacteria bacterium]|uniref:Helix-turn-helix domain-containing protein n=1 Tax=Eiseniibacteriota bacterium TaxID=2212470 RepID=A0ABV6YJ48_UNCEI